MSNLSGRNLGPYRIMEQIGKGGMATVYKAYQPSVDRYVAIKVLPAHFAQDPTFVERFEREARTIARLEHPHILPVYDYGKADDGTTYIVMRYIEAGTLADLLAESVLFLEEGFRIFIQIGEALAYAHAQGVVHRDMKPSNVLMDMHNQAFLTDFGLARIVEGDSSLTGSAILGTPAYMAPEQGEGKPADERSDIYALGIMLYEMTTGRRPFEAETPMAVMLKHMTEPLPLPRQINPALSPAIERVILKALAKTPAERFQTVDDMVRALQAAIQESPVVTAATSPSIQPDVAQPAAEAQPATSPPAKRPPWFWPVLGGVGLIVVLWVALAFFTGADSQDGGLTEEAGQQDVTAVTQTTLAETAKDTSLTVTPPAGGANEPPPAALPPGWTQFSDTSQVRAIALQDDLVWVGSEGGLIAWNRYDGSYHKYTMLDGLSSHNITSLLVTQDGELWAGTDGGGVMVFDGTSWEAFTTEDGLDSDTVLSLFETEEGALIAGTAYGPTGFNFFDGQTWHNDWFPPAPVEFPKPVAFANGPEGLIVGLADEGGLLFLIEDQWTHFIGADGLPSDSILSLAVDAEGELLIVTDQRGGIGYFDGQTFEPIPELADTLGTVIYTAPNGNLWLGTDYEALWLFEGGDLRSYDEADGLPLGVIRAIIQDEDDIVWLGVEDQGMVQLDDQTFDTWALEDEPPFHNVQQILEADDGQLWFVQQWGGEEVAVYDPASDTWEAIEFSLEVNVIALDPDGSQWVGTSDGLWRISAQGARQRFSTQDGLPGDYITALTFGPDDGLWVGTETGLGYHNPKQDDVAWRDFTTYIPSPHVSTLYTDPDGTIWIGTAQSDDRPAGVAHGAENFISGMWLAGEFSPAALAEIEGDPIGSPFPEDLEAVQAFVTDASGYLWVGTIGGGLWRWRQDEDWRLFSEADAAPGSDVLSLAAQIDGTVWLGTYYDGLWGFHEAEGWWQETPEDGLPGWNVSASYLTSDGSLWVSTESGIGRYVFE